MTQREIDVFTMTISGEAEGESDLGMIAVGWAIKNRAKKYRFGIAEACLKSIHFSCWNNAASNDANQFRMLISDSTSKSFARCEIAARQVFHNLVPDPTNGATHYMTKALRKTGWPSSWGPVREPCAEIDHHLFYNNVA